MEHHPFVRIYRQISHSECLFFVPLLCLIIGGPEGKWVCSKFFSSASATLRLFFFGRSKTTWQLKIPALNGVSIAGKTIYKWWIFQRVLQLWVWVKLESHGELHQRRGMTNKNKVLNKNHGTIKQMMWVCIGISRVATNKTYGATRTGWHCTPCL